MGDTNKNKEWDQIKREQTAREMVQVLRSIDGRLAGLQQIMSELYQEVVDQEDRRVGRQWAAEREQSNGQAQGRDDRGAEGA